MTLKELDCVALVADLPEYDLKAGDIGTIVDMTTPTFFIVEFSAPGGYLSALLDVDAEWVRPVTDADLENQRQLEPHEYMGTVEARVKNPAS